MPIRHATELVSILRSKSLTHPVVFLYSDGGPDHSVMYTSVKLALIALFGAERRLFVCSTHSSIPLVSEPCRKGYVGVEFRAAVCWPSS